MEEGKGPARVRHERARTRYVHVLHRGVAAAPPCGAWLFIEKHITHSHCEPDRPVFPAEHRNETLNASLAFSVKWGLCCCEPNCDRTLKTLSPILAAYEMVDGCSMRLLLWLCCGSTFQGRESLKAYVHIKVC